MRFLSRRLVLPNDLNYANSLFGGRALAWIDEEAAIFAICQLETNCLVTKHIGAINFEFLDSGFWSWYFLIFGLMEFWSFDFVSLELWRTCIIFSFCALQVEIIFAQIFSASLLFLFPPQLSSSKKPNCKSTQINIGFTCRSFI